MHEDAATALLISTAAGMCTLVGGAAAVIKTPGRRLLAAALGFSAGIMATVSIFDLIRRAAELLLWNFGRAAGVVALASACCTGALCGLLLDVMLPEGGRGEEKQLMRLGIFSMLALLIHNLPEGVAVFLSGCADMRVGLSLGVAIALHNIPEGVMVAMPIFTATKSRAKAMAAVAVSGFAEPAGALWAWAFLQPVLESTGVHLLYGGIGGLMLYIALAKLLPASAAREHAPWTALGFLAGAAVMGLGLHLM
jgi:ZIP family zinc transporter